MLEEYTQQAPLNHVNERAGAVTLLLSGNPLANWQNVLSGLPEGHAWTEQSYEDAMQAFALQYCSATARQEQKRFMKHNLGLPTDQLTTTLLARIRQFNRYLPYLPGTGNKFDPGDIREMLYNSLPTYIHTIIATSDYKWYDGEKTDTEVCSYFDCLLVIDSMARGEINKPEQRKQDVTKFSFKNSKNKFKADKKTKGKPKCTFCGNLGHEEAQCRIKQKASAEAQKQTKVKPAKEKNNILEVEELANELEYLDDFPEIQEFMENMNSEVCVNHVNDSSKVCTVNSPTTGLILEISVAITLNSEVNPKSKLLNKVLIDTGCTRTIIKKASLPDQFFEQRKQHNEVT